MDKLKAVRLFTRVVETGSFAKAADSLRLPRNSATKLVQALETHLRIKLLNRTTRRVSPTTDGNAYYERMSRLLEEWQEVESELLLSQAQPRGKLRVDMASALATHLVIPALPLFQTNHPNLQLDIGVGDRPIDLLVENVDCVVRAGTVSQPSLIARHLGDLPLILCATQEYLKRHGHPRHPGDLERGHTLVRYFYAGSGQQSSIELASGEDRYTVQGSYFVSTNDANAQLVAGLTGLGILHTHLFIAKPSIDSGKLVPILQEWSAEPVPISVAYSPNRHLSARVRIFVNWMAQLLEEHPHANS
jgi:DNA-binding transcriptional LysR family regulator